MSEKKIDGSHRADVLAYFNNIEHPVCCYTCEHYIRETGWCYEWQAYPPEDIREKGCDKYLGAIPF